VATFDDSRGHVGDAVAERSEGPVLYESNRTRISRRSAAQSGGAQGPSQPDGPAGRGIGCVIWKEPLGPGAGDRLQHEVGILTVLAAVPGVAHLAQTGGPSGFAVEDVSGVSLASTLSERAGPDRGVRAALEVVELVAFALALARVLIGVHQAGVMHKDINPSNILITGADRRPVLIDWDLATTFALERPGFTHESTIAGTLAYLAPEQSGRTGRGVDQRADLYAVGATLYEVAVGQPPFADSAGDVLALIHDHLARVPRPPTEVNSAVPVMLSDLIMRLLEKEPDRRYQSAAGLAHDLTRLLESLTSNADGACGLGTDASGAGVDRFALGERDFPARICAPSQLVGREGEIAALGAALELAVAGGGRGLLVTGAAGVGKTSLIGELRSIVTDRNGWFVQGKFDQYRQDESTDAVAQAMRALARLLLAEPEDQLAGLRERIRSAVGLDTDVLVAVLPEFGALFGVAAAQLGGADPQQLGARLFRAGLGVLRAVTSPQRPLVMVIDDLQWAGAFPIAFLDAVLMDDDLSGLLLIGAYRDGEVDQAHPLTATLARWDRLGITPTSLQLVNLPSAHLGALLGQMLRLPPERALELGEAIKDRTKGNPYDTVELINALRHEGALSVGDTGWQWDTGTVRRFVGHGDVLDLISVRINALPVEAVRLLDVLACLGGEVDLDLLAVAAALDRSAVIEVLTPALEDGLLVMIHDAGPAVQFRHDRVQQAAAARLEIRPRQQLQLQIARRLAVHPQLEAAAAEQYLGCAPDVTEPGERYRIAVLFRAAAAHARVINQVRSERFLAAALGLLSAVGGEPGGSVPEFDLVTQLLIERHAVLSNLARFEETNELYEQIQQRVAAPAEFAAAAAVQISSLTHQRRALEAVTLSTDLLARLGFPPPREEDLPAVIGSGLDLLERWVGAGPQADELDRPEPSDPRIVAATCLIERTIHPAYISLHPLMPWLVLTAYRIWVQHGSNAHLVASLSALPVLGMVHRQDYVIGYQASQRILAVSQARGYEPASSQLRAGLALFIRPWFEPMEEVIRQARAAREGLLRYGELPFISYTFLTTVEGALVSAPTVDDYVAEYAAAVVFCARIGDETTPSTMQSHQQLMRCLLGQTHAPGSFDDDTFDETAYPQQVIATPIAAFHFHWLKVIAAAIFWDPEQLAFHSGEAMRFLPRVPGRYPSMVTHLLRALALADRAKMAEPDERVAVLVEFDVSREWLAARAADASENFGYLVRWLDAERAWGVAEVESATSAFEAALQDVTPRCRPWHAAIITERAARFHLAHGHGYTGRSLLTGARTRYQQWGATAKVTELDREFPDLRAPGGLGASLSAVPGTSLASLAGSVHTSVVSSETIDLMAVLRASQALSSETNLDQLRAQVVEVLTAMTGATSVRLLLWNPDAHAWSLSADGDQERADGDTTVSVEDAGAQGLVCLSAFRYAERTLQPLLVSDATHDDRFARDPYLEGLAACSLLVVPILSRGVPRAMLLMENRLSHGAFTASRLDAVVLIAGQLAVCLDNALAERFRSLVQRSSDLTLVCDRTGTLSYASAAATEILGIPDTQLIGHPITGLIHPDDRDTFTTWIRHDAPTGQMLECRVQPADSGLRWVEVSYTDLTSDPAVAALVLHLRDVTERHHLEAELRHAQKLESVGQLAAGIAHEINTPIQFIADNLRFIGENVTPITGLLDGYRQAYTQIAGPDELATRGRTLTDLEEGIDLDFLREEIPLAAAQAIDGTQRVARIVSAMKAFAHPGGEGKTLCDLNEAIRNTLIVADSVINPVADLVLDLGDLPPVLCDLGDINQAILNLAINAAHAMAEAATADSHPTARGILTIRTRNDTDAIRIDIQDTGTGIPDHLADRVFDQFFTTKPVGVGTGQGLALVHTLIHDRHHGTITFTTQPGAGTTFTIRLPNKNPDRTI
jgi:PAS domain S-box-containing protein